MDLELLIKNVVPFLSHASFSAAKWSHAFYSVLQHLFQADTIDQQCIKAKHRRTQSYGERIRKINGYSLLYVAL